MKLKLRTNCARDALANKNFTPVGLAVFVCVNRTRRADSAAAYASCCVLIIKDLC